MQIVTRAAWGARHDDFRPIVATLDQVYVHHTAGPVSYADQAAEAAELRAIESYHTGVRGWDGIAYSFVIFPSGRVYQGRGWGQVGAHTHGHNSTSYGVAFAGNGEIEPAPPAAWQAARGLIALGVAARYLNPAPAIGGHRDVAGTACPGRHNYDRLDLLRGITEEDDMPLSDADLALIEALIRRVLNEGAGPGQNTWSGTSNATLDGVQRTYNHARAANGRLEAVEAELAAVRQLLDGGGATDATQVLDRSQ